MLQIFKSLICKAYSRSAQHHSFESLSLIPLSHFRLSSSYLCHHPSNFAPKFLARSPRNSGLTQKVCRACQQPAKIESRILINTMDQELVLLTLRSLSQMKREPRDRGKASLSMGSMLKRC